MNIDNTFDKSFWFISSNQYYTTHQISGDVYLQKGEHFFKVMYFTSCDIVAVDTKHVWYGGSKNQLSGISQTMILHPLL